MKRKFIIALILVPLIAVVAFVAFGNGDTLEDLAAVETQQPEIDLIVESEPEPPAEEIPPEELNIQIDAASDEFLDTFQNLHQIDLGAPELGEGVTLVLWTNRPLSNFAVVGLEAHFLEDREAWGFMPHDNFGYAEMLQPGEGFVINNYMGMGTLPHLGISFADDSSEDTKVFFLQENNAYPEHGDRWIVQEIEPERLIWERPDEHDEDSILETDNENNDNLLSDESEALPLSEINYPTWQTVRGGIDPNRPMIALTFDDGPSIHTIPILDALEFHGGVATFFVLGNLIEGHRDIAQRIHMQGNEIANHTWSHQRLTDLSERDMHYEIYNASVAIAEITGFAPAILRPTYGAHNEAVIRVAQNLNLPLVLWTLDTRDWYTRDADMIFDSVMNNVRDRDIIIMHDIREPTADAAVRLIPALIEQGFQLVTVSELFYHSGVTPTPGRIYNFGGGRR
jgi:peptidoglycan/xylan/chitin deacetylase (PgdA/CDA1 family)